MNVQCTLFYKLALQAIESYSRLFGQAVALNMSDKTSLKYIEIKKFA
jgi:hypothetical protein